ncbi:MULTISPECIES: beta-N-acetylhexosaminidase [unclassified Roseateles]|uniref:beta-N-acetylhexosaminidase n=1 Tax=unclassified Roseateles TaxID=2626991 RepID=UPI0006F8A1FB|nr:MULTISPECIES: beta-N-acetylhexosaminidase [unclassified Roseateles]KQW48183.1 beta-N-acetylhexosaminidase [Pelomonas sp. Root405]KRA75365.1 beta-N-acetylhexosaminidase [Pelomonas sp. Root662]
MSTFDPGRLVMVDIPGQSLDAETASFLREQKIRSVCLFRKNIGTEDEVRALMRDLIEVLGPEALIGIDQEGGAVVRVTFLPQPPSAMALGASGDADRAEAVGAAVARGLKSLGINWNFAPVLDVNNNPSNPVIGERSFSNDPVEVSRLAAAWMRGSLREGVACCVKHFPGHGDTHVDSHHALPTVDKSRAELNALELAPFKALASQAPAMMTAHIVYPQIDPDRPATLSPQLIGGILRQDWGYDGVVITDALMMKAVAERFGYAKSAVMAIEAGADMVLAQGSPAEQLVAINALRDAFGSGRLTPEQGEVANARLDKLAAAYPARVVDDRAAREADHALMAEAWAAGLTALRGAKPPALDAPIRVIVQGDVPTDMVSEAGPTGRQAVALFDGFRDAQVQMVDDIAQLDWTTVPRDGRMNVLVSTRRARYGLAASEWRPDLHLSLWNPYQALDVAGPTLLSWGFAPGALAGIKAWLEGRATAGGRAPAGLQ